MEVKRFDNFDTNKNVTSEKYTDKDMKRGDYIKDDKFGVEVLFPKDYRQARLIIKKLVRFKAKLTDEKLQKELDGILDMIEGYGK